MNVGDLVERNARLFGHQLALTFEGCTSTHEQFARRVFSVGNALLGLGVPHQGRVAILMRNRAECLEVMYGCACAGLISVSLNWRLSAAELTRIVRDCEPEALFYESSFADLAEEVIKSSETIRFRIAVGASSAPSSLSYESLVDRSSTTRPAVQVLDEDIESLVYTSGTTGDAKGVMLSHRAIVGAAVASSREGGIQPTDRVLIVMPLFHVGGKIEQMAFWAAGAATFLNVHFESGEALAQIERDRLTAAHLAPTMIAMLLEHPTISTGDYRSLRLVHYASAPMPVPLLRSAINRFGPIFVQIYGMTECVLGTVLKAHLHKLEGSPEELSRLASAGQPYLGVDIRIEGPKSEACHSGEPGEVLLRGVALMSGYWNRTGLTISTLRGGWMQTGDVGYLDSEGFLYIVDRKKDMVISGGENIYSREVEEALLTHVAVKEAAVVGVPDPKWGESVFAFVVLAAGAHVSADELIQHCREKIASYKKPRFVSAIAVLPRIHNGKIDKKQLRNMAREERARLDA